MTLECTPLELDSFFGGQAKCFPYPGNIAFNYCANSCLAGGNIALQPLSLTGKALKGMNFSSCPDADSHHQPRQSCRLEDNDRIRIITLSISYSWLLYKSRSRI